MKPTNPMPGEKSLQRFLVNLLRVLGVIFFLLGVAALVVGSRDDKAVREQTLLPVSLKAGETIREEFTTGNSLRKDLVLRLHRPVDGTNSSPLNEWRDPKASTGLDWRITDGSTTVASGVAADTPQNSYRIGNIINLGLTFLSLKPGTTYRLEATFNPQLSVIPPDEVDVVIKTSFADAKTVGIRSAAYRLIGAILCMGAIILAGLSFLPKRLL